MNMNEEIICSQYTDIDHKSLCPDTGSVYCCHSVIAVEIVRKLC